nr:MFS transporter [Endozoicomonas sp. OPT23]
MVIVYAFNYIDRQLMTILLEPIKNEFQASDTVMGLLTGFAFAVFYATLGVPVARLADSWSRKKVLTISLAFWSGFTALCGMATSFWQLALLRVGVGIGEAGGTSPSQALIAEYFPPEKRSTALSIHATGTHFGVLIGMFGGAMIADAFGWRMAFIAFGLPGVLLSLLMAFSVREPARKKTEEAFPPLLKTVKEIWNTPGFSRITIAAAFTALSGYGLGAWAPSFMIRVHGLSLVETGLILGIIGTASGLLGAILGGVLCDRLSKKDQRWQLWLPAIGAFLSVPFQGAFLLWPEQDQFQLFGSQIPVATLFMIAGGIVAAFWIGPTYAAIQNLSPDHMRTQASAILLLVFNLVGMGIGPVLVGVLSDQLMPAYGNESIRFALVSSLCFVFFGSFLYLRAATHYCQGIQRMAMT